MPTKKPPAKKTDPPPAPLDDALLALSVEELLAENNRLAAERSTILERQRTLTAELDRRALDQEARRRSEAEILGQTNRPRTQGVFGALTNG